MSSNAENGSGPKIGRTDFIHAIRSPYGEQLVDEVLQAEAESPLNLEPVFISVAPEHFFAAVTAGVIFDEANRFRPNGIFLSEGAVRFLEDSGVPITRVNENPEQQRRIPPDRRWTASNTGEEENRQDTIQGEIIRPRKPRILERSHRRIRTSPDLV